MKSITPKRIASFAHQKLRTNYFVFFFYLLNNTIGEIYTTPFSSGFESFASSPERHITRRRRKRRVTTFVLFLLVFWGVLFRSIVVYKIRKSDKKQKGTIEHHAHTHINAVSIEQKSFQTPQTTRRIFPLFCLILTLSQTFIFSKLDPLSLSIYSDTRYRQSRIYIYTYIY